MSSDVVCASPNIATLCCSCYDRRYGFPFLEIPTTGDLAPLPSLPRSKSKTASADRLRMPSVPPHDDCDINRRRELASRTTNRGPLLSVSQSVSAEDDFLSCRIIIRALANPFTKQCECVCVVVQLLREGLCASPRVIVICLQSLLCSGRDRFLRPKWMLLWSFTVEASFQFIFFSYFVSFLAIMSLNCSMLWMMAIDG